MAPRQPVSSTSRNMEGMYDEEIRIPCSSLAVDSFIRIGAAGLAWGSFYGSFEANRKGLTGTAQASFVVKLIGKCGLQCGIAASTFSATHCTIQQLRMRRDWLNASVAGAVTGAVFAMRTRSVTQILGTAAMVSVIAGAADYSSAI